MRGIAEFNFPAFEAATEQLRAHGYKVISPAEQDLGRGFDPSGLTGHEDLSAIGFDLREALLSDLRFVAESDVICLLPGWEDSLGARAEAALAEALNLSVRELDDFQHGWMPEPEHSLIPPGIVDAIVQEEKKRNARLDRLDAFLATDCDAPLSEHEYLTGELPMHVCDSGWFDRSICPDPCGMMHSYCDTCGERQDRCAHDVQTQGAEVRITSATGGQKGTKLARFDLIPTGPLWAVAELYGYGTRKYADRNWERGYNWSLSYAALQRHANLFWSREDDDTETGLPHLAAVAFHAFALMEYTTTHPEFDDRPEVSK